MGRAEACICRQEIEQVKNKLNEAVTSGECEEEPTCITQHPGFHPVCINRWVLQTAWYQYKQQYRESFDSREDKLYRHIAYRQPVTLRSVAVQTEDSKPKKNKANVTPTPIQNEPYMYVSPCVDAVQCKVLKDHTYSLPACPSSVFPLMMTTFLAPSLSLNCTKKTQGLKMMMTTLMVMSVTHCQCHALLVLRSLFLHYY